MISVLISSRAARLLEKDPHGFGATVKRLYLSGQAGGAELRELLAHTETRAWRPTSWSRTSAGRLPAQTLPSGRVRAMLRASAP